MSSPAGWAGAALLPPPPSTSLAVDAGSSSLDWMLPHAVTLSSTTHAATRLHLDFKLIPSAPADRSVGPPIASAAPSPCAGLGVLLAEDRGAPPQRQPEQGDRPGRTPHHVAGGEVAEEGVAPSVDDPAERHEVADPLQPVGTEGHRQQD